MNESHEIARTGFGFAKDLAQQLITLSTGILALTVTFVKDHPRSPHLILKLAWITYLLCIFFGVWHMMALTGTLMSESLNLEPLLRIESNIKIPATLQVVTFLIATVLVIIFGAISLRRRSDSSDSEIGKD